MLRRHVKKYGGSFKLQQEFKLLSKFCVRTVYVTSAVHAAYLRAEPGSPENI